MGVGGRADVRARLDHRRPLWALDLVGPLDDGRQAIVARIHRTMTDGISAVRFLSGVLWDSEQVAAPAHRRRRTGEQPSLGEELRRLPEADAPGARGHASPSPLDRPIRSAARPGLHDRPAGRAEADRRLATGSRDGQRRPARRCGRRPALVARRDGGGELRRCGRRSRSASITATRATRRLGNRDSFLNVDLPLAEADPLTRLDLINAETSRRKRLGDAQELCDLLPRWAGSASRPRGQRLAGRPRASSACRSPTCRGRGPRSASQGGPSSACARSPSRPTGTRCGVGDLLRRNGRHRSVHRSRGAGRGRRARGRDRRFVRGASRCGDQ